MKFKIKLLLIIIRINILLLKKLIGQHQTKTSKFACKNVITNLVKQTALNKNELIELSKRVKAISAKGLTQDLINEFSILKSVK